jgi:hypothetical protein
MFKVGDRVVLECTGTVGTVTKGPYCCDEDCDACDGTEDTVCVRLEGYTYDLPYCTLILESFDDYNRRKSGVLMLEYIWRTRPRLP